MKMNMTILHKISISLLSLLFIALLFFGNSATGFAFIRPANPVMDYVPQNIGFYDTYYDNIRETECRHCHGSSTAERHHDTQMALEGNCLFCHNTIPDDIVPPERDCKVCHIDNGPLGDLGSPHHRSDLADSGQCNQCHNPNLVVETNTVAAPSYAPSSITPTPYACENCHWPSGQVPDGIPYKNDWKRWTGYPIPSYLPDGTPDPQPIVANGPVASGDLNASKPYQPMTGSHHEVGGKVFPKCYICHASPSDDTPSWDSENKLLIRFCENCHAVGTLHSIREHVMTNNIYRVGGTANSVVTANEKCVACHGDSLPGLPPLPAEIPTIDHIEPGFGPPGMIISIIPATETCFLEDPINGTCSFGQKMIGDRVQMKQTASGAEWIDLPIYSWSEQLIQVKVPSWTFVPGNTKIRVHKQNIGNTALQTFSLREHPVVSSLTPGAGNWGTVIDISGTGFGVRREKIYADGYGYSTYVELHASNDKYRVTKYNRNGTIYPTWGDTGISVKIEDLVDINTGSPVPDQQLYVGCWNLEVIRDYFKDDNDGVYNENGHLDLKNSGNAADVPNATGSGDELLYREISTPICFTVLSHPSISCINPNLVVSNNTVAVYGSNFGPTRGTSVIRLWNKAHKKYSVVSDFRIFLWSNTKIKFQAPANNSPLGKPKIKDVQIVLNPGTPQEKVSNFYRMKILVAP
jgi:hypothetical protein